MQNLILPLYIFFSGKILNRSLILLYISSFLEQNQNGIMIPLYNEIMLSYYPPPPQWNLVFIVYFFSYLKSITSSCFYCTKGCANVLHIGITILLYITVLIVDNFKKKYTQIQVRTKYIKNDRSKEIKKN